MNSFFHGKGEAAPKFRVFRVNTKSSEVQRHPGIVVVITNALPSCAHLTVVNNAFRVEKEKTSRNRSSPKSCSDRGSVILQALNWSRTSTRYSQWSVMSFVGNVGGRCIRSCGSNKENRRPQVSFHWSTQTQRIEHRVDGRRTMGCPENYASDDSVRSTYELGITLSIVDVQCSVHLISFHFPLSTAASFTLSIAFESPLPSYSYFVWVQRHLVSSFFVSSM